MYRNRKKYALYVYAVDLINTISTKNVKWHSLNSIEYLF